MKIVFWGTPETAVPFLEFLSNREEIVAVITQPDKPAKRGQKFQKPPVKMLAEDKKIPVLQPANLRDQSFLAALSNLKSELGFVAAYGKILPKEVIQLFPKGIFNIHFSLLPLLRGAAPIQRAILLGNEKTGVTIFRIAETLDTGGIAAQKEIALSPQDDAISLEKKLVPPGILAMEETLDLLRNGNLKEKPQTGQATFAPILKKEEYEIHWNHSAEEIRRQVRALVRTGAFTRLPDRRFLKILHAESVMDDSPSLIDENAAPGTLCGIAKSQGFLVKCRVGSLLVLKVKCEGKNEMDAWSFLQGAKLKLGGRFS